MTTEGEVGQRHQRAGSGRAFLILALSLIVAVFAAAPASASVNFTKQWIGGSEFVIGQWLATDPSSGDVYVVDSNLARVLKLDSDGALIGQLGPGGLGGDPGQYNGAEGVAVDSSGNVYVSEAFGNRIQKFDSNGNFVLMWGKGVNQSHGTDICTAASGDTCQTGTTGVLGGQFNFADGLAVDSAGNVFVAELGNDRVQEFDSSGTFQRAWGFGVASGASAFEICTTAATCHAGISGSGNGQFNNPVDVTTDSGGNVYVADRDNHRIEKFDSSAAFLTKWGSSGTGPSQFTTMQGLATNSADQILAVDFSNNDIQTFSASGTFIHSQGKGVDQSTGGDLCTAFSGHTCGPGSSGSADGQFNGAADVAVDSSGNIWVADQDNNRVQKFSAPGSFTKKVGTSGTKGLYDAGLFYIDVATDAAGNVYTTDHDTNEVQQFDPLGASMRSWSAAGTGDGEFDGPAGTVVAAGGDRYVIDETNNRIEKFDANGTFERAWGWGVADGANLAETCQSSCQAGIQGNGDGQFNDPTGIGVDSTGNVYVADTGNDRIQKFTSDGTFLTKWGSQGTGNGQFNGPHDVAVDSLGNVYVTDTFNNRVQRFSSTGVFLGKWGTLGTGPGQFNQPFGVTTDNQRNVYVTDYAGTRIEVFRPSGAFIKQWGSVGAGPGEFNGPSSIAIGTAARVYVADSGNNRVQMFTETDTTPPQTAFTAGPNGITRDATPTFRFSSSQPAGALFECRIDSSAESAFKPCASPKTTAHLGDGFRHFDVRAIDSAGNVDQTPARRSIKVDTHAPSSTARAPASTHRSPFDVSYTATDPLPSTGVSRVELWARRPSDPKFSKVAVDTTPSTSRFFSYTPHAAGTYRFYTRAWDKAGNYERAPSTPDATTVYSP